jgi:Protein of unknown function (DUF1566)
MTQRSSNRRNRWVQGLEAVGLVAGGLLLAGCGSGAAVVPGAPTDLSGVTQNWDKAMSATQRFVVLATFNTSAVRDNETGLVWEKSPQITTPTWDSARLTCTDKNVGGRKGWRLPSVHELASLVDPSVAAPGPTLPPGHPFLNVQSGNTSSAWLVNFNSGLVGKLLKTGSNSLWCVRGGMNADTY